MHGAFIARVCGACSCQIALHVAPGALRVRVLDGREQAGVSAEDLAWRSDLVITTFQRLSNEKRGLGAASPLMKVSAFFALHPGHLCTATWYSLGHIPKA